MHARRRLGRAVAFSLALLLAACGGGSGDEPAPPVAQTAPPDRYWNFDEFLADGLPAVPSANPGGRKLGGRAEDTLVYGPLPIVVGGDPRAFSEVFSSETGNSYYVFTRAPAGLLQTPASKIGARTKLIQYQGFRKQRADAKLRLKITRLFLEAIDANSTEILYPECPWSLDCGLVMTADVDYEVHAYGTRGTLTGRPVFHGQSAVRLSGWQQNWTPEIRPKVDKWRVPLWNEADFAFDNDAGNNGSQQHATLQIKQTLTVEIDLSNLAVGDEFNLRVTAIAQSVNRRQRESYLAAYLRDPVTTEGNAIEVEGLEPVPVTQLVPPVTPVREAAACTTGPDPAAGVLQFSAPSYRSPELPQARAEVVVTRAGGSRGAVSARLTTQDGGAVVGADYRALDIPVYFDDGDTEPQRIEIPLVYDRVAEPDEDFAVTLSDPRGCAQIGTQAIAEMRILDEDRPQTIPTYAVNVTVDGLAGNGLQVQDVVTGAVVNPVNNGVYGFRFAYPSGQAYDVRVTRQPQQPDQSCTVRNGTGVVGTANVTDVQVTCATITVPSGLDTSFGSGGKVVVDDLAPAAAVVVQSDGRIVVLTRQAGAPALARFDANGAPDTTFGTNGRVLFAFTGGALEEAYGLALQLDDKLVVVGRARVGTAFDMGVRRFNADGSPDLAFGTQGLATLRPLDGVPNVTNRNHLANRALIQADGRIAVAGVATYSDGLGQRSDFAVGRLNADGSPDTSFGAGRGSFADISGGADVARSLGQQADGKVVLAGAADNGAFIGLARFRTDGLLDTGSPPLPEYYGRDGSGRVTLDPSLSALGGNARDMVMLPDDSIVVAAAATRLHPTLASVSEIRLLHLNSDGGLAGSNDVVVTPIGPDNDVPAQLIRQADGKFVLVGAASSATTVSDFVVVRYNADLSLDTSFGTQGVFQVDFFGARDGANGVAVQRDGKIVAAGSARNGASDVFAIVRVNP